MELVRVSQLTKRYQRGGHTVDAVAGVSFDIKSQETLALIGESGSGKSTIGRITLGLIPADSGQVWFEDHEITRLQPAALNRLRASIQIVFQEPYDSLNPKLKVRDIVSEPLAIHAPRLSRSERRATAADVLERVGLPSKLWLRFPAELSGGQQQRVGIARAIVTKPRFVVLDEPTSSLDLSIRARILALLGDLQRDMGLTYLFISHDISTVASFSSRVAVLHRGAIVEEGETQRVLEAPSHPYTRTLVSAALKFEHADRRAES